MYIVAFRCINKGVSDPLDVVAAEISDEAIILCLDEFMVTDVADAMILNQLSRQLFSKGVILVSNSNCAPDKLYEGGLQRGLFLPFVDTLKERCIMHPIGSAVDYRQMGSAEQGFYFIGKHYSTLLKQRLQSLIGDEELSPQTVEVIMGRKLQGNEITKFSNPVRATRETKIKMLAQGAKKSAYELLPSLSPKRHNKTQKSYKPPDRQRTQTTRN